MKTNPAPISLSEAAKAIAAAIRSDLTRKGEAVVIWSGGRTPKSIVEPLSREDLDWTKVAFIMGDERWVPLDDPASNEGAMRAYLAGTPLEAAAIEGLYRSGQTRQEALAALEARMAVLLNTPACVALLGMGPDGHTASLFPGGDWVSLPEGRLITPSDGPPDSTPERISLTPAALKRCDAIFLLCNNPEKQALYAQAAKGADPASLPVAAFLQPGAPQPVLVT
ncbi:6-phosphogluconolactonase [Hyphobacterium sp. HN65]|uniref:6-phosphogluconolactonase n=1 Tax=Hyphobacterium lacteum TaxID=3116575 RepID=A0ABU7LPP3_9PROT|nr:6-phosphogluconolactonase [Hyphobacterium sp. HN65]MEE2525867.1 6-phosphogluconolactonase [Hyphobacterium sp. HN65]